MKTLAEQKSAAELLSVGFLKKHDLATTLQVIKEILNNGRELYYARKLAEEILRDVPDRVTDEELKALHKYATETVRYTKDIFDVEMVKTLENIYKDIQNKGNFLGDCDDVSVLLGGLLKSVGYKVRMAVISTAKNPDDNFDHIFVQAYHPQKNAWVSVDGVLRGKLIGTEIPYKKIRYFEM